MSAARDPIWVYSTVQKAKYLGGHRVWIRFEDGLEGELDLEKRLWGPIFEPLKDPKVFAKFRVDETLCWPNGADFSPEYLWDRVRFEKFGIKPVRKYLHGFFRERPPVARRPIRKRAHPKPAAKKAARPKRRSAPK